MPPSGRPRTARMDSYGRSIKVPGSGNGGVTATARTRPAATAEAMSINRPIFITSNDEVARRGAVAVSNDGSLWQSSTPSWLTENATRDSLKLADYLRFDARRIALRTTVSPLTLSSIAGKMRQARYPSNGGRGVRFMAAMRTFMYPRKITIGPK